MKRAALFIVCVALCGCGDDGEGESGACASGIVLHGDFYVGTDLDGPRPPRGEPVEGGIQPACNDSGPPLESDHEVRLRKVSGVPPEVAVYGDGSDDTLYLSPDNWVFLGGQGGQVRRVRGAPCLLTGTVVRADALRVRSRGREWNVRYDQGTRMVGFERSSLPYLRPGERVRVRGFGCPGSAMVARRIELQP